MLDSIKINAYKFTLMEIYKHLNVSEKTLVRLAKEKHALTGSVKNYKKS